MKNIWKKILIAWLAIFCLGACVLFYSRQPGETIATVLIDPGHGGYDTGAIGADGKTYEKDLTLDLAFKVGKDIKKINPAVRVEYTRTDDEVSWPSDEKQDLQTRVRMAENMKADYFICIHMDSSENPNAAGYSFHLRSSDSSSINMAEQMEANLEEARWSHSRGLIYTDQRPLYVVDHLEIPSILIETGFISNSQELRQLKKWRNQKKIARAIAQAVCSQIEQEKIPD